MKNVRKKKEFDYSEMTAIEVYELVCDKTIKRFPYGFVTKDNMKEIIREVILNRLNLGREEICNELNRQYLTKYHLGGARKAFKYNIFNLITYCFPEMKIKYWELKKAESGFWEKYQNRLEYMRWLVKKHNINVKSIDDLSKINAELIDSNHGSKARIYSNGIYELILMVAEVEVKEWQVIKMAKWTEEKAICAVKWLIEEKLKWTKEEVINNITVQIFYDNDLGGLLSKYCGNSPLKALQIAYPGEYTNLKHERIS